MFFRVCGNRDFKIAGLLEKRNEGRRRAKKPWSAIEIRRPALWRITSEGDNASDTGLLELARKCRQSPRRRGHECQMGCRIDARIAVEIDHGIKRPIIGGAAGTVCHREKCRRKGLQLPSRISKPGLGLWRARRKKLEADCDIGAHAILHNARTKPYVERLETAQCGSGLQGTSRYGHSQGNGCQLVNKA